MGNNDFAVIKFKGSQQIVKKGDELQVDKINAKDGEKVTITEVLLLNMNGETQIGTPILPKAEVIAKIVKQSKGKKIDVYKFKAKSRYRRQSGHRRQLTKIKITSI